VITFVTRLFLLYFLVIALVVYFVLGFALFQERFLEDEYENPDLMFFGFAFEIATLGAAIVVIRKWSREWNEKVISTNMSSD